VGRRCTRDSRTRSLVFTSAPRVTARAHIVRARSRVSEDAVHVQGRRDQRYVPTDVCTPNLIYFEHPRASCAPGAETSRFSPVTSLVSEACASCSPRAAFRRATLSRPETKERAPTGSGPSDASKTGDPRVSRRANRWVSRSKNRVGIVRPSTSSSRPHPGRLCRLPRFSKRSVPDRSELVEGCQDRFRAPPRER